jgi:hypothetical protein
LFVIFSYHVLHVVVYVQVLSVIVKLQLAFVAEQAVHAVHCAVSVLFPVEFAGIVDGDHPVNIEPVFVAVPQLGVISGDVILYVVGVH